MTHDEKIVKMSTERRAAAATGEDRNVRAYLREIRSKYRYMQTLSLRAERYREMAMRATGRTDAVRLSGTSRRSKVEDNVLAMVDIRRDLEKQIQEFFAEIRRAEALISRLSNPNQRTVLQLRYFSDMTWEEIADKMGYTLRWVHQLHRTAIAGLRPAQADGKARLRRSFPSRA